MKTISTTAIVAMMITTLGLGAVAPAMAQQGGQPPARHQMHNQGDGPHRQFNHDGSRRNAPRAGGMLGGLLDFSRGGENIEIALVRLSHRVDLSDEQKTLLDTFKTAALTAQAEFATTLAGLRPAHGATATPAERPNMADRLTSRITLEKAHVDALTAVQPSFTALIDSLTDEQKAKLMPQRQHRMGWGRNGGHHRMHNPDAPATPDAPAMAPETPAN